MGRVKRRRKKGARDKVTKRRGEEEV